jgi:hypothetical protein
MPSRGRARGFDPLRRARPSLRWRLKRLARRRRPSGCPLTNAGDQRVAASTGPVFDRPARTRARRSADGENHRLRGLACQQVGYAENRPRRARGSAWTNGGSLRGQAHEGKGDWRESRTSDRVEGEVWRVEGSGKRAIGVNHGPATRWTVEGEGWRVEGSRKERKSDWRESWTSECHSLLWMFPSSLLELCSNRCGPSAGVSQDRGPETQAGTQVPRAIRRKFLFCNNKAQNAQKRSGMRFHAACSLLSS